MSSITGYMLRDKLYEGPRSFVFRTQQQPGQPPRILKVLKDACSPPRGPNPYHQEHAISRTLDPDVVMKTYGLKKPRNGLGVLVETPVPGPRRWRLKNSNDVNQARKGRLRSCVHQPRKQHC